MVCVERATDWRIERDPDVPSEGCAGIADYKIYITSIAGGCGFEVHDDERACLIFTERACVDELLESDACSGSCDPEGSEAAHGSDPCRYVPPVGHAASVLAGVQVVQ